MLGIHSGSQGEAILRLIRAVELGLERYFFLLVASGANTHCAKGIRRLVEIEVDSGNRPAC